ncbi:MAG: cyanoexosortase A, partial [Elainellaceae cyanobacterium]
WLSILLGLALLIATLWVGPQLEPERYLAAAPFFMLLGLLLFSSGWRNIMQYRQELLLMFMFGIPKVLLWPIADLRGVTASFSTRLLQLLNFNAVQEGRLIHLPLGSVEVIRDCSGLNGMLYLLAISTLFLVMMPVKGVKRYSIPVLGTAIAFLFNGVRVCFLAIMAADPDPERFDAWHSTSIFSLGALAAFTAIYCSILWYEKRQSVTIDSD